MSEEITTASVSPAPVAGPGLVPGASLAVVPGPRQPPRRIKLTDEQLETISHEDLIKNWREHDAYVDLIESQTPSAEAILHLRECEERIKQQYLESTHREKVLVRRLATKEQEMQEYVSQIAELKSDKAPGPAALRSALLDPAVNLLLQRLRQELVATKARLDETQNELSAWKFTPDSNTGKRLMAKCRLLHQENEELGRTISSGRLAKLEGDLALQKSFSDEVKKSQSELDEFLQDLDEDVEGMQSTIYYLQQELRKAKDALAAVQQENQLLKNVSGEEVNNDTSVAAVANEDITTEVPVKAEPTADPEPEPQPQEAKEEEEEEEEEEVEQPKPLVTNPIEPDESANQNPPSPVAVVVAVAEPQEAAPQHWDESSDSGELILNIEAEAMEEETDAAPKRKRTDDGDNVEEGSKATKKVRRDSELSLHCSEDEEMLLKEAVEEESAVKSPAGKVSDVDDSSDDTPLSLVRRDSQ